MAPPGARAFLKVVETELDNGLKVRLLPDHHTPLASLQLLFGAGSRNERPGITGISHLFEHMYFNGTKRHGPGEFDRVLEFNAGDSNAYTTQDMTVYHESFAAEALETVLDLEADRMSGLRILPKVLEKERGVVLEERRLRVDNDIGGMMSEELEALAFKAHPYRWPVIGWEADIRGITRADCEAYFQTYYAPNNATLYVAGDFDPKKALAAIERAFRRIPRGPPAPPVLSDEPEQRGERRAEVRYPAQAQTLLVAFRAPAGAHRDTPVLDVLQFALAVGEGSRLVRDLIHERKIAVGTTMDWSWRLDPGLIVFSLDLKPDVPARVGEKALLELVDACVEQPPRGRELQKAKNNLRSLMLAELSTNASRAAVCAQYEAYLGSWRDIDRVQEAYASVTTAQVRDAAERYFDPRQRTVVTLVPEAA